MFTVIKLGGCNGSGKTSIAREIIKLAGAKPVATLSGAPLKKSEYAYAGFYAGRRICVLGSYEAVCGGMDTISDKDDRLKLIKHAIDNCDVGEPGGVVFFEGLITGKTYGAIGALSEEHIKRKGKRRGFWLYAFMDTPFDVCVARTEQRRRAAGNLAPLDAARTLEPTFRSCQHLAEKLLGTRAAKVGLQPYPHPVHMVNHKLKPATAAKKLLDAALEMHNAR